MSAGGSLTVVPSVAASAASPIPGRLMSRPADIAARKLRGMARAPTRHGDLLVGPG
jgi:hypothetical protein